MEGKTSILEWATNFLTSNGYPIEQPADAVLTTPWSVVMRFTTQKGIVHLKQSPSAEFLSSEPTIIRFLSEQLHANVPNVIGVNDELHCFLTKDAGEPLRKILKNEFNAELLSQAIIEYASILRSTERITEMFLDLGVPDWRLDKLPTLYDRLMAQSDFLESEGLTSQEIKILQSLSPQFLSQCKHLSSYGIPETLGYHDFHDNNVLIDPKTQKMTFADWGETAIIHPFFPLYTCLQQAIVHHGVKEGDETYQKLQNACLENWSTFESKKILFEIFALARLVVPFFGAMACYQFMMSVNLQAYKAHSSNRPSKITQYLKEYIGLNG